ncbi:hypothetical protein ACWCPX_38890 [Streptomyces olivaceoviridis]
MAGVGRWGACRWRGSGEAAGQGNNAAVGYHFGTKVDLVRAVARRHAGHIEALRERALAEGTPTPRATWDEVATGLADAIVGLWLAPVGTARRTANR